MTSRSQNPSGFRLPPEISCRKERLSDAPAYVFRHQTLGLLGRIVLRDAPRGRTYISFEVAGDPRDPNTAQRTAVLEPLTRKIMQRMDEIQSGSAELDAGWKKAAECRSFGESKESIARQLIFCDRCAKHVALLIFAPGAIDAGHFEDYARQMYPEYSRQNLPTWIVGPGFGGGSISERPADMLKVWPEREPIIRQQAATLKAMIDEIIERHCG